MHLAKLNFSMKNFRGNYYWWKRTDNKKGRVWTWSIASLMMSSKKKMHEKIGIVVGGNLPAYLRYLDGIVQITSGCAFTVAVENKYQSICTDFI